MKTISILVISFLTGSQLALAAGELPLCEHMGNSIQRATQNSGFLAISSVVRLNGKVHVPERNVSLQAYYSAAVPCRIALENRCETWDNPHSAGWVRWCGNEYLKGLNHIVANLTGPETEMNAARANVGSALLGLRPTAAQPPPVVARDPRSHRPQFGDVITQPPPAVRPSRENPRVDADTDPQAARIRDVFTQPEASRRGQF